MCSEFPYEFIIQGAKMIREKFENVSVKARVSYGICCLERTLLYYNCTLEKWKWVLEKLWKYTSMEYLDDWYYEMAEYLPDSLLEDTKYNSEEFEYITEEQFYILLDLYRTESNKMISQIFRLVFEMGTIDIYSELENFAPNSLNCLEKIENIMNQNNIELPPIINQSNYSFQENNGWGKSFEGKENSIIL